MEEARALDDKIRQAYADHYEFLMPELLADCQRLNPLVTVRDLITSSYTVLASKE